MTICTVVMAAMAVEHASADEHRSVIVVQGVGGTSDYAKQFRVWSQRWLAAAQKGNATTIEIGFDRPTGNSHDLDRLKASIQNFHQSVPQDGTGQLWIVLIGHGTYDGRSARFNLRGLDVKAKQLTSWTEDIPHPVVIINCASSSAPFLKELAGKNRVVITSTKSGAELNFARFGDYLSQAIGDTKADLDKDGQVSVFEAFLAASRQTENFYKTEGRLATEHAILDDTGDGQGVRSDWFRGVRAIKKANNKVMVDGRFAHQIHLVRSNQEQALPADVRGKRNALELEVVRLRDRRESFNNMDDYYAQLEALLVELAELYEQVPTSRPSPRN